MCRDLGKGISKLGGIPVLTMLVSSSVFRSSVINWMLRSAVIIGSWKILRIDLLPSS
jgi:hypothetical protein